MAKLVRTDGSVQEIPVPSLKEAQKLIGGYVERVAPRHSPDILFLCDEDGLRKDLPTNFEGQRLYGHAPIVGDIIVISKKEKGWRKWL